ACLGLCGVLIWLGYQKGWSGLQSYTGPDGKYVHYKTLWDWFQLLVVPAVLALAALTLSSLQKSREIRKTEDQQREVRLQAYLDGMTALLLDKNLRNPQSEEGEVRTIARARTLTVFRELDGKRKGLLMRFLVEANLVHFYVSNSVERAVINLSRADLSN